MADLLKRLETPRPLTTREREVLEFFASIAGPAGKAPRSQAATASVVAECECGCGAIDLSVDEKAPRAEVESPIVTLHDPVDRPETLWLMLWLEAGRILGIEVAWIADEAPRGLPSVDGFSPTSPDLRRGK